MTKDCQKLALVGLGGIGKTQVALEFAYAVKAMRPEFSIFWVAALSAESFEQACAEIARKTHLTQASGDKEDVKELFKQSLSAETAGQWLLIIDNADDMDILFGSGSGSGGSSGIADYFPTSEDGLILFTTRFYEAAVALAGADVIELKEMSREEAVNFLEKSLIQKDLLSNEAITFELLDELTYLPLAIAQATGYLNTNRITITQYLRLLRNTEQDIISIMSREFRDSTRYRGSQNAVATTWLVSFDQILKSDPIAADLLSFMSCIEPKAIPRSILPVTQPEERMVSAIGTLSGYTFMIRRDNREVYDLHRLVHLATRIWVGRNSLAAERVVKAIRHVAGAFPLDEYANRGLWREYLPHSLKLLESNHGEDLVERYILCTKVGRCLRADGRVGEALRWLKETFRWNKDNLGEEDEDRLESQRVLASAYLDNGQIGKAVELLEHVVAVQEVLGEEHPSRLASQYRLAIAYRFNEQIGEAAKLLEHVLDIREKVLVEEHPERLAIEQALASVYRADGQVGKAVKLLEHVVAIREKVLVEKHPHRLNSQQALAIAYKADGQVGKAVKLLEHVLAIREKVLVEEHPDRLKSQHALALTYKDDGQVGEAVKLLEHVVAVTAKVLGEEHSDRLASEHELALAYRADGQICKAIKLLEHVVTIQAKVLSDGHPLRLLSQKALADSQAEFAAMRGP